MAKLRINRKSKELAAPPRGAARFADGAWVAPVMLGLFGLGLLWIVIYYVTGADYPVPAFGNYNLLVGFSFITGGFIASTQWK